MHRLIPQRWRTFTAADVVVVGGFLLWHVVGANSSDDGYILGMARVADHAGYMSNYFRWFGSPEDPFGWYYNLLALMTQVSDASIWMRLPDLICALVCWLLLSREVLPRLGPAVASSKPALWAAGLVLLAAWMPFNNGLRPEGQIATGALITYVLIERAIISGRMTPAALAIIDRRLHPRHSADRADRGGGAARRWPPAAANPGAQASHRRHVAAGRAAAGGGHRRADRGVRRPDAGNGVGGHQDSHRDRPEPGVVHREPALLLPDPADGRRLAVAAVRLPDHRAVACSRRCSSCCGASGFPASPAVRRGG